MKTDFLSVFETALLIGVVALAACSDSDSGSGSAADSPAGGAAGAQAGCPAAGAAGKEAGCPAGGKEAGCPAGGKEAGCPAGGKEAGCPAGGKEAGCPASTPGDAQTPPTGAAADIDAWLAKGDYKTWACESAPHDARSPSPHGKNRICSNTVLSAHGEGEFPIGAAGVKELYDASGTNIVGHALYLKTAAGAGEAWYWYETTMSDGVIANGSGASGTAKSICVGCHSAAGADAKHSGHDFVYTQVK